MTRGDVKVIAVVWAALVCSLWCDNRAEAVEPDRDAVVRGVYDCDTMTVTLDLGLGVLLETGVRVYGIAAPEVTGAEKRHGLACREQLRRWVGPGDRVKVHAVKRDKYGRVLAQVRLPDGRDLASELLSGGWAVLYHGTGPMPRWPADRPYPLEMRP